MNLPSELFNLGFLGPDAPSPPCCKTLFVPSGPGSSHDPEDEAEGGSPDCSASGWPYKRHKNHILNAKYMQV